MTSGWPQDSFSLRILTLPEWEEEDNGDQELGSGEFAIGEYSVERREGGGMSHEEARAAVNNDHLDVLLFVIEFP